MTAWSRPRRWLRFASLTIVTVVLGLATVLPSGGVSAATVTLLPPGHTWEYTFTDPTGDPLWNTTTGSWSNGPAPFGNNGPGTEFDPGTFWPADGGTPDGDDLWVRTAIDLTGIDLSTVLWGLGVDNGFKLYANGTLVASGYAEGYTFRWEYSGGFGSALVPGVNVIAVALEDRGGATAFDMEITGTPVRADTTPPTVTCSATPNVLWPANHKMRNVTASVAVADTGSGPAGFTLVSVISNEPDNGLGDGDTPNDIQGWSTGTADTSGQLRAERSGGGTGRVYTLTYQGADQAGNTATCSVMVTVPHDQGK